MIRFSQLAAQLNLPPRGSGDPELVGLAEDSRLVRPGVMFAAVRGTRLDGRDFIPEALARGASAVLMAEPDLSELPTPRLVAPAADLRAAMARAAAAIHGYPARKMRLLGLTGTNGKTTAAALVEAVLRQAGLKAGVMGTIDFHWPGVTRPAPNTTPEGPVLQETLAAMARDGVRAAAVEVSSHALALGRVAGLAFDLALFTNLSRDHLDFHADLEDYFQAKRRLFTEHLKDGARRAVINIDDPYGARLAAELGNRALTFGFSSGAQVRGRDLALGREGLRLTIDSPFGGWLQTSPLLGEINARNLLGAAGLGLALELPAATVAAALTRAVGAPGRLERVGGNSDYLVLVDYAHSPEALEKILRAGRDLSPRRLLCVFGCGGDRDRGKRPLMGRIAGEGCDLPILTSDNPRTEEPRAILEEVEAGFRAGLTRFEAGELNPESLPAAGTGYLMAADRRTAIFEAVRLMAPGDLLIIAGKGHEDYQIIGREKRPFDDRREALAALRQWGRDQ